MSSDSLLDQVGSNIQEKSAMIWNVADNLDGPFTHYFYEYIAPESSESIAERISMLNSTTETATEKLSGGK